MKKLVIICTMLSASISLNAQTGKDAALETMGSLSAFSLYDAYCVIGVMADAYIGEVYEAEYVTQIIGEQIILLTTFTEAMDKLNNSGFITEQSDKDYIASSKECASLLSKEAEALQNYLKDPTTANSDSFQNNRNSAWIKISALLGIK